MKILRISCVLGGFLSLVLSVSAQTTFTTLYSFNDLEGYQPISGLVQATNGDLYGTAPNGGANNGFGTVFKITPSGTFTTVYTFCQQSTCLDGYEPYQESLIQATNGDLYGTTNGGGAGGGGTVFKITPGGTLTTLTSFDFTDGGGPDGGVIQGTDGNFYGTTFDGGANGQGTVFKMTPGGTLTTLYNFCNLTNCTDGANPWATLVQATNGNFYGTTSNGGTRGDGTVFKITPSGTLTTLYSFEGVGVDGGNPHAALIQGRDGNLYGTTYGGGTGTVFKITPSGTFTTLHTFSGTDGEEPQAALVQATNGNFYGTTEGGGASFDGTVFEITPTGTLTTLYNFCSQSGCTDGTYPFGALVQDTNGTLYGTTYRGGANDAGTVFRLSVGLGLFVETQPTSGRVGAAVKILGTDLTGATSVSFNGSAATFTVVSESEITTTVPTGATTGTVDVTIPSRMLKSNIKFRVTP